MIFRFICIFMLMFLIKIIIIKVILKFIILFLMYVYWNVYFFDEMCYLCGLCKVGCIWLNMKSVYDF